jgi:hypothetical protein
VEFVGQDDEVLSLAAQPDNQLLAAGTFSALIEGTNGLARYGIARIGSDGALDRTFDPGTGIEGLGDHSGIRCMQVEPDGNILIGGDFRIVGGLPRSSVARLIGTDAPSSPIRRPPTFRYPAFSQYIVEGATLVVTNWFIAAPDSGTLTFSLDPGAPEGMGINAKTGVLSWIPSEGQGPSTNAVTVRVSDDGAPPLQAAQTFVVYVSESNTPPLLEPIPVIQAKVGEPLQIQLHATDSDLPKNSLTFWLGPGAPADSTLDVVTGLFRWTPSADQVGTNSFDALVADDGQPPTYAVQPITVAVAIADEAVFLQTEFQGQTLIIRVEGVTGKHYMLESSADLNHWTQVKALDNGQAMQLTLGPQELNVAYQFFRAREL